MERKVGSDILFLNESDIKATSISIEETIDVVEDTYRLYSSGLAVNKAKLATWLEAFDEPKKMITVLPAYIGSQNVGGMKLGGLNFDNPIKRRIPSHHFMTILQDGESMVPIAVLESSYLTLLRTAANGAIGMKYLGSKHAHTVTLVGAGAQSILQLKALSKVMKIEKVYINDIRKELATSFQREMSTELGVDIEATDSLEKAISKSDVTCLVTSADESVLRYRWVKKGALISSFGVFQQCDFQTIKKVDKIVVDHIRQTLEMGELAKWAEKGWLSASNIYAELSDVITGKKNGRENDDEVILFVPIGMGMLDIAMANLVYKKAIKMSVGQTLKLR